MSTNSNPNDGMEIHSPDGTNLNEQAAETEICHRERFSEISVGYTKHRRSYLDKQPKEASTEAQLRALQEYHHLRFSPTERFIACWIFCQKPIVQVGELSPVCRSFVAHMQAID